MLTQVTKTAGDATIDDPILNFPGDRAAFISNAPEFKRSSSDGQTIVVADISDPQNPIFTSLINTAPGVVLDDVTAPNDFSFFAFESENLNGDIEQIYLLQNCNFMTEVSPIPTLSEWGLIALAGILGIVGFMVMRRKKASA